MTDLDFLQDESIYAAVVELSSEAIWINDYVNRKAWWKASAANQKKYGLPKAHELNDNFWEDNLHPDDKATAVEKFKHACDDLRQMTLSHEYRFIGANNRIYYIFDSMKFFRDANGAVERVVGVWKDVSEIRHQQKQLMDTLSVMEDERKRFKMISEITHLTMWEVDFETRQVTWYAGTSTLEEFGRTDRNYALEQWEKSVYEGDRERVIHQFNQVVQSDQVNYFDTYRVVKSDGSLAQIIDQGLIIRDSDGRALRGVGGWIDLTTQREREEALEKALEKQRRLVEKLAAREAKLTKAEEELRYLNNQLQENLRHLEEREFILKQSQLLAKIGNWEYDVGLRRMTWSNEMYSIYGVDKSFDVSNLAAIQQLFDEPSGRLVAETFQNMILKHDLPFDITAQLKTPLGYKKWIRLTGHPLLMENKSLRVVGLTYDITYFKEAEERLKTSEEKFSKAFRANPDLMMIFREHDQVILDVNDRILPALGYQRTEVVGRQLADFSFFENARDGDHFIRKSLDDGSLQMETRWRRKEGRIIDVVIANCRIEIDQERFSLNVIQDISARKTAEERFSKAFDLSPDLMLIFREKDLVLIDANSKLERTSGYRHDEVLYKQSTDFDIWVDPDDRQNFFKILSRQQSAFIESRFRKKDGEIFFCNVAVNRVQLAGENHLIMIVRDITERKQAEQRLIQSEANLYATMNNTNLLVWSADRDYKLIAFNKPFEKFIEANFGLIPEVGKRVVPEHTNEEMEQFRQRWIERYDRALRGESLHIKDSQDDRHYEYSLHPIQEKGKIMGISVFAEEVTERVKKEQELSAAYQKIGELRLTALQSVMNPHFVFNALNSIQYFIAQNDRKNAINYLATFSRLIRSVLNSSLNNKIKLSDEINQLQDYVNLEMVRFENKFDFHLHLDDRLNADNIEIPPLLIQPFVENAIIHGLYNKEEKGHLKITIMREPSDRILVEIEDDGVGRDAARKLREQHFPKHQSIGTALTAERLKLINAQNKVSYDMIDLYENEAPAGTLVKIWLEV